MCQDGKDVYDLAVERRTIRRFKPEPVPPGFLERLVNAARLAPSAANVQPLEFVAVDGDGPRAEVFPCLKWAAYISPAGDPGPGEEEVADAAGEIADQAENDDRLCHEDEPQQRLLRAAVHRHAPGLAMLIKLSGRHQLHAGEKIFQRYKRHAITLNVPIQLHAKLGKVAEWVKIIP